MYVREQWRNNDRTRGREFDTTVSKWMVFLSLELEDRMPDLTPPSCTSHEVSRAFCSKESRKAFYVYESLVSKSKKNLLLFRLNNFFLEAVLMYRLLLGVGGETGGDSWYIYMRYYLSLYIIPLHLLFFGSIINFFFSLSLSLSHEKDHTIPPRCVFAVSRHQSSIIIRRNTISTTEREREIERKREREREREIFNHIC